MSDKNYSKQKKVINTPKVIEMSQSIADKNDPNGSYTGVPIDKNEVPVQDADDL